MTQSVPISQSVMLAVVPNGARIGKARAAACMVRPIAEVMMARQLMMVR